MKTIRLSSEEDLVKLVRGEMFPLSEFDYETERENLLQGVLGVHVPTQTRYVLDTYKSIGKELKDNN